MARNSEDIGFREVLRANIRGLKIWWRIRPQLLISQSLYLFLETAIPFSTIYFLAQLIDELAGLKRIEVIYKWIAILLGLVTFLQLAKAFALRWKNIYELNRYFDCKKIYSDKMLSMDFQDMDSAELAHLLSQIKQSENWAGFGLSMIPEHFNSLIKGFFYILGGLMLSISLFTRQVPQANQNYQFLNHPIFLVIFSGLLLALTLGAPKLENKAKAYWLKITEEAKYGNRVFSFYGFLGYERKIGPDIRIYEQNQYCLNRMRSERVFMPGGRVAQYAKGPMGIYNALAASLSRVLMVFVYVFVCLKAWAGAFGIGSVSQYIGSLMQLSQGLSDIFKTLGEMKNNTHFLKETYTFLDIPNKMYQGSLTVEKRTDHKYEIEFRDVSFKYPNAEIWALRHVSAVFKVGERLAIVGENGSGKTTFIKLLCRLYDPDEGEILLNGIDIKKYNYEEYMKIFSIVFQDFKLMALTLGQNVAASHEYQADWVKKSLDKAGFSLKMEQMPQGLETYLYKNFTNQGVEVSGGEAQKIAIGRALYHEQSFLILDEPTAALDPIAEAEIYSQLNEIVGEKTAVFISHRLSSCRFSSRIFVFDKGEIVQIGTHESLVKEKDKKYAELWEAQAQYYTVVDKNKEQLA